MSQPADILFCHCAHANVVDAGVKRAVRGALSASGARVRDVPDLCGLAAKRDPLLKTLAAGEPLKIVACYPRAVQWLFAAAGTPLDDSRTEVLNMRTQGAEEILDALPVDAGGGAASYRPPTTSAEGWLPWFPVIDYDRCIGCKQCMNFCLFGVYGVTPDGKVTVSTPAACKTHCPACARICPEAAIIFPKYATAPFNGDVVDPDAKGEAARVDVKAALSGDVYAALRKRSGGNGDEQQALDERTACANLKDIQEQLDIPDEVINSLNPPESLRRAVCECECDCSGMPDEVCDRDCDCAAPSEET
jgi:NAD-dependent dihydropyrimidine dehydrogenase PreA subunit